MDKPPPGREYSKSILLCTTIHIVSTLQNTYHEPVISKRTIHQLGSDLEKYLITAFIIKTGQPPLCSRARRLSSVFLILFSFLSQKIRPENGVFPQKNAVIPLGHCGYVPPDSVCFTYAPPSSTCVLENTNKSHFNECPCAFACFAQFVHNQFSAIFAIF